MHVIRESTVHGMGTGTKETRLRKHAVMIETREFCFSKIAKEHNAHVCLGKFMYTNGHDKCDD